MIISYIFIDFSEELAGAEFRAVYTYSFIFYFVFDHTRLSSREGTNVFEFTFMFAMLIY